MRPTLRPVPGSLLFAIGLVSLITPNRATEHAAIRSAFGPAGAPEARRLNQAPATKFSKNGPKRSANPQKSVLQFRCSSVWPRPRIHVSHPRRNALVSAGAPRPPQSRNLANRPKGCPADRSEARPRARPGLRKDRDRGLPSDAGRSPARDADGGLAPRARARVPRNHVRGLNARDWGPARPRPY